MERGAINKIAKAIAIVSMMIIWTMTSTVTAEAAVWKLDRHGWLYRSDNGRRVRNEWIYINGIWYYFDRSGYMMTGWVEDNGTWYYLKDSGAMATGWVNDNGTWYYLKDSGAMATGWVYDNGAWYYLKDSGAMATGWVYDNGAWYYLKDSGAMATGWVYDNGAWYYLKDSGAMATGWINENRIWYYMNTDGSMETDFVDVTDQYEQLGLQSEEVTLNIPGLQNEYTFLWVSDLHIIAGTQEISQDDLGTVEGRIEAWQTSNGVRSADLWKQLPPILDSYHADAVFLGGDMIDHASEENIVCLKQGTDQLQTPFLYVRADHDLMPYYCVNQDLQRVNALHEQIDGNHAVSYMEFEDLCVIGINNSSSQLTSEALAQIKTAYAKGKPIIIVTHVPLDSMVDTSLSEKSKQVWQDRNLSWGDDCYYEPDEVTQEFLDMVYADDSLIKGVFCGHMHFSWDGQLTENSKEHVFSTGADGTIGIIHVGSE